MTKPTTKQARAIVGACIFRDPIRGRAAFRQVAPEDRELLRAMVKKELSSKDYGVAHGALLAAKTVGARSWVRDLRAFADGHDNPALQELARSAASFLQKAPPLD